jgi:putative hemolysin
VAEVVQLALIPFFILLNGFFSGAELAVLSASRPRLADAAAKGSRTAAIALRLKDTPDRFLPTIQIGITIVGSLASAIGGLQLVERIEPYLITVVGDFAGALALLIVVGAISYLTLVFGELAPKNLALKYPEAYATAVAAPIRFLESAALPAVRLLDWSTALVLIPFGGKLTGASRVGRDELRNVLLEAYRQGTYSDTERALLHRVIEMMNLTVADVALPRVETVTALPNATVAQVRELLVDAPGGYVVLYDPGHDMVHGILGWREVLQGAPDVPAVQKAQRWVYVPESAFLPQAIDQMQAAATEVAVVVNEYGEFEGVLPLISVFQRQVLAFTRAKQGFPGIKPIEGGWLIKGNTALAMLREHLALPLEDSVFFTTLGGFVLEGIGRLPAVGDTFELYGYRFTVRAMDRNRVDEVEVTRSEAV